MCSSRLPGEVLVCWRWHSSDLQQLHACPVPLWLVWPEQDGHLCRGRQIPEGRPRRRAQGQRRLAGERHPVGILRNDCKHLELSTRPRACVWVCVIFLVLAKHYWCFYYVDFFFFLKQCLFLLDWLETWINLLKRKKKMVRTFHPPPVRFARLWPDTSSFSA